MNNVISNIITTDNQLADILYFLGNTNFPVLKNIFYWLSFLGNWKFIIVFTVIACAILWVFKKRIFVSPLLLTVVGSESFVFIIKLIFHRSRPSLTLYQEDTFSFPSGHSALAMAVYGFLVYIFWRQTKTKFSKIVILITGLIIILLIGFSRLYLGVHYLSDVIAGYVVGVFWMIVGIKTLEFLKKKKWTLPDSNR